MGVDETAEEGYEPSYRQQDIDDTLDEHHTRIRRLEKGALVVLGYGIAQGSEIAGVLTGLL